MADDVHRALRVRAAETGETMEDILDRALRSELGMVTLAWQVIEDGGGNLYLIVFNEDDDAIYYGDGFEADPSSLLESINALRDGSDPRRETWDLPSWVVDGEHDVQKLYDQLTCQEFGWQIIADEDNIYYDRMGAAGQSVFSLEITECNICSEYGELTPATRKALGKDLCDACAAEYESYLHPGERLEDMTQEQIDGRIES